MNEIPNVKKRGLVEQDVMESDTIDGSSPLVKRPRILDADLPDVDDDEEFPKQIRDHISDEDEIDDVLQMSLPNNTGKDNLDNLDDLDDLIPPGDEVNQEDSEQDDEADDEVDDDDNNEVEESNDEIEQDFNHSNDENTINIVDVDQDDEQEEEGDQDDEEDDEDEDEIQHRNQVEAEQLLQQVDGHTRSLLALQALERYGEELFYGYEDLRDGLIITACARDGMLAVLRRAVSGEYMQMNQNSTELTNLRGGGTSASPLELDNEDDENDEEDEENEEMENEEDEICLISEEETDEVPSQREHNYERESLDEEDTEDEQNVDVDIDDENEADYDEDEADGEMEDEEDDRNSS